LKIILKTIVKAIQIVGEHRYRDEYSEKTISISEYPINELV
jgi:hypothetical protein